MIPGLHTRTGPARTQFTPSGVYYGNVKRVDQTSKTVWVEIPRVAEGMDFGPLNVLGFLPEVGDTVGCMFVEGRSDDIVVLGVVGGSSFSGSIINSKTEGAVIIMEIGP